MAHCPLMPRTRARNAAGRFGRASVGRGCDVRLLLGGFGKTVLGQCGSCQETKTA